MAVKTTKQQNSKRLRRKIILIILAAIIVAIFAYTQISSYVGSLPKIDYHYYSGQGQAANYPDAGFAVISDLHFYDKSLGTTGAAFEETLYSDRKLLLDSEELLDLAIGELLGSGAGFVLVSGDLTKDGERINHERVSAKLQKLVDAGIKVFVVPGNHDVNNPDAVRFVGDGKEPVDSVTAEEFSRVYENMGYKDAIMRDENSLSYVAEPVDGLWIMAIDSCRYAENEAGTGEIVGGMISQGQENWLADALGRAAAENKAVIVLMHHGLMEHWDGQDKLHPDYIVDGYKYFGESLSSFKVRVGFTGHYHALDVTRAEFGGNAIYDVETGSLVTAPCPIRFCEIADGALTIKTKKIIGELYPGTDFAEKADAFVKETVKREAYGTLKKYHVSDNDSNYIAGAVGEAFAAHYAGDEDPALRPEIDTGELNIWGKLIFSTQKYVVEGLWEDLNPPDNDVIIDLNK